MSKDPRRLRVGSRIGDVSVLGHVDKQQRNPLYIVWHRTAWCPMACKVFRSHARAKREADILASFSHPNAVRFMGLSKPALLLMEFLEGPTLEKLIDSQASDRMSVSNAVRIAIHIGGVLNHVHEQGYLHLDVKPGNVIVARGRPVLFDFGSARPVNARRPSRVAGTDPYIAPEECLKGQATAKSDIFGLGATLYEMLTGDLPFAQGTRRDPFPQTRMDPLPMRKRVASLPKALDELVLSCLLRNPADRPRIDDLLPALHAFIRSGPAMWPASFRPGPRPA